MKALPLILFLTACSVQVQPQTPEQCRAYGVAVKDGTEPIGTVVSSEFKSIGTIRKLCPGPITAAGCARAVEGGWPSPSHQYEIYYADMQCVPQHEWCHAAYERWIHTIPFNIRVFQGDPFPSCPDKTL